MERQLRQRKQRQRLWIWALASVCVLLGFVWAAGIWKFRARSGADSRRAAAARPAPARVSPQPAAPGARPVYRHSVIRGGAYSAGELAASVEGDPVVAAHYASFDRTRTYVTKLPAARTAFVSYRVGDKVYWTAKKVTIPAGEPLLTDGTNLARARCGNRVADTPQLPIARVEPKETELDSPEEAPPTAQFLAAATPASGLLLPHDIFPVEHFTPAAIISEGVTKPGAVSGGSSGIPVTTGSAGGGAPWIGGSAAPQISVNPAASQPAVATVVQAPGAWYNYPQPASSPQAYVLVSDVRSETPALPPSLVVVPPYSPVAPVPPAPPVVVVTITTPPPTVEDTPTPTPPPGVPDVYPAPTPTPAPPTLPPTLPPTNPPDGPAVPEPGAIWTLLGGGGMLYGYSRFRARGRRPGPEA